jgi:hypothetical protein
LRAYEPASYFTGHRCKQANPSNWGPLTSRKWPHRHNSSASPSATTSTASTSLAVREIKGWSEIYSSPQQPDYVRGVLNLRGVIVHHRSAPLVRA